MYKQWTPGEIEMLIGIMNNASGGTIWEQIARKYNEELDNTERQRTRDSVQRMGLMIKSGKVNRRGRTYALPEPRSGSFLENLMTPGESEEYQRHLPEQPQPMWHAEYAPQTAEMMPGQPGQWICNSSAPTDSFLGSGLQGLAENQPYNGGYWNSAMPAFEQPCQCSIHGFCPFNQLQLLLPSSSVQGLNNQPDSEPQRLNQFVSLHPTLQ
jgi:hypothetical protein